MFRFADGSAGPVMAAAVLVGVLVGCGTSTAPATGLEAIDGAGLATVDETYEQIWGTGYERDAARFVAFATANREFALCMRDHGQAVRLEFEPIFQGMRLGAATEVWIGPMERRPSERWSANQEARQVLPGFDRQSDPSTGDYRSAAAVCLPQVPEVDEQGISQPDLALQLGAEFQGILDSFEETLPSATSYRRCMKEGGFTWPEADYVGTSGAERSLSDRIAGIDSGSGSAVGTSTTALPAEYLADEQRFVEADEECRGPVLADGLGALTSRVDEFRRARLDELAKVQREWADRVTQAQAWGFPAREELAGSH